MQEILLVKEAGHPEAPHDHVLAFELLGELLDVVDPLLQVIDEDRYVQVARISMLDPL